MKLKLSTPITRALLHTTDDRIDLLREIGIFTLRDFLEFFPRAHEDYSVPKDLSSVRADEKNLLRGVFLSIQKEQTKFGKIILRGIFQEEKSGTEMECVWFNNPTLLNRLPIRVPVMIFARAKLSYGKVSLQNPEFEQASSSVHFGRIAPVYREHKKLSASWIRQKIHSLLPVAEVFPDILPKSVEKAESLLSRDQAIRNLHFPESEKLLSAARKTMAFEKIFLSQLSALLRKKRWEEEGEGKALSVPLDADLIRRFFDSLPFTPTNSQKIAIFEILKDFEKKVPMLRLLEGDVGSGKTLVAISAAIPILEAGGQVAFLAPTEILAKQHLRSISHFLHAFRPNVSIELLTGSITGKKREQILHDLRMGHISVILGTHALLEENVVFQNLSFVVIDEQHRFGVFQRDRLIQKGAPHTLQMTATPIPRTLAMIAYGDQALSVLMELPPGRKVIHTKVVPPMSREQVMRFVALEVEKGRQGFVVCPLVHESDALEVKAATKECERLREECPNLRIGLLHGQMSSSEKDEVMRAFQEKVFDILVSTAVVEVGVDVPNATMMLIEGAERFGIAQLHQFRGRVGRGEYQSYCFLFPTEEPTRRLRALEQESCGFRLAEIDLHLRGPGELFGTRQSGIPDLTMEDVADPRIVATARSRAEEFLENHSIPDFPEIERVLQKMERTSES
ncbi:ATP-dependent DNA helicase RecG [Candidatus Peregrinibacteria bacterium]|nr:MAG: ATP-dependent DNA helicase RecG [Candidatus Peregrinibacteria bacterium]